MPRPDKGKEKQKEKEKGHPGAGFLATGAVPAEGNQQHGEKDSEQDSENEMGNIRGWLNRNGVFVDRKKAPPAGWGRGRSWFVRCGLYWERSTL